MRRSTLWRVLAIALPALGALAAALPAVDLAYQLRAGAEILDHGAIPAVDTWTFTVPGTPWLDQQWGAQVLLTLVYRLGGWTGLALLRAGLVAVAFWLLLLAARRRAPALGPVLATLLVIAAFVVSASALALRPQLFAIDLFAATLLVLAYRDAYPRAVWLVPLFGLAWGNLHGTFLLAPGLCGLAWITDLARMPASRGAARHRMLVVGLVTAAATAVTPFGPAVWGYVANLTSNPTIAGRVSEWQPPSPLTLPGAIVWVSLAAVLVLTAARVARAVRNTGGLVGAIPWPEVLALLVFGGFAAVSGRGTAWWPFVAVLVVAPWLAPVPTAAPAGSASPPVVDRPDPPPLRRLNLAIAAVLVLAGIALLPAWRPASQVPGAPDVPKATLGYAPLELTVALSSLTSLPSQGAAPYRVWNPQPWGSWLEFAAPAYRYALDSRIELFPAAIWADADALDSRDLGILDRNHVDIVVTDHHSQAPLEAALGASGRWAAAFEGCDGEIWVSRSVEAGPVATVHQACP